MTDERKPTKERPKPLLRVDGLSKTYSKKVGLLSRPEIQHAVWGVSFDISAGRTVALVGESGCGKSTLGRLLVRLIEPTYGRIFVSGRDVTQMSDAEFRPYRKRLQIVFQDPETSLNPQLTVRSIVSEGAIAFGLASGSALEDLIATELSAVGLSPDALDKYPDQFSGGQRQRIAIARAMILKPEFVVCDEIVSALDASVQAQILNLLLDRQAESNVSYLLITHDLAVAEQVSRTMLVMFAGRIVEMGRTEEIAVAPRHPYTQELFAAAPKLGGEPPKLSSTKLPTLAAATTGCAFRLRCPAAEPGLCDGDAPSLQPVSSGSNHRVACFKAT